MTLSEDSVRTIQGFVCGDLPAEDFYGWVISASDDDELPASEREALEGLRLLLLEYGEGLRPLDEARAEAKSLLASSGRVAASS